MRVPLPPLPSLSSLPGPGDLVDGAAALREGAVALREGVTAALELVPRATAAMGRLERLLDHAEAALTRADAVLDRADSAMTRTDELSRSAAESVERSKRVLEVAEITARDAGRAVEATSGLLDRLDVLTSTWEKPLRKLAPSAQKFADALDPNEVQAAISLIDRLPVVLDHLENDVLPMLQQLDRVGPDVHELLEVVEDVRRVITGLPGVGLLRRRGEVEPPEIEGSVHDDGAGR